MDNFNGDLVVIAHSIGNAMFIKYISENNLKVGKYISLAGFSKDYYNDGKDILNEKVKLTILNDKEKSDIKRLSVSRFSIYSDNDHIVPVDILKDFSKDIESIPIHIPGIGHMGKKSGLDKLPKVIELVINE